MWIFYSNTVNKQSIIPTNYILSSMVQVNERKHKFYVGIYKRSKDNRNTGFYVVIHKHS